MAEVEIQSERVDDVPLLVGQQQKVGLAEIIAGIIHPHWRRQGLSVGQKGLLYLGDSKREAWDTRAHRVVSSDYYLIPLSLKGEQAELLAELVQAALAQAQELVEVYRERGADQPPEMLGLNKLRMGLGNQ